MSRIWRGPALEEPRVKGNVVSFIFKNSHLWKNLRALECGYTGKALTYGELQETVELWGAWLTRHRGDDLKPPVVARFTLSSVEVGVIHLGTIAVGAVYTTLVITAGARELAAQIDNSGATLIVSSVDFLPRLREALEKLGRQIPVVVIGDAAGGEAAGLNVVATYQGIISDGSLMPMAPVELSGDETAQLLYTSGSTGLPKPVEHAHNTFIAAVQIMMHPVYKQFQQATSDAGQTRFLMCRDFGLAFPMMHAFLPGLAVGTCLVLKQLDEKAFRLNFEQLKINATLLVPPNLPLLIEMAKERPDFLQNFRYVCVGGGAIPSSRLRAMNDLMPHVFVQNGYGASEAGLISLDPRSGGKPGFLGQICPNVCVKVVSTDGRGELLPANQRGIIYVKSSTMMKGYLNDLTATREVLDEEGWYNTGDFGLVDENGFIQISDRLKEMIKLENAISAAPTELENTIMELDGVQEACVVGAPVAETGMDAIYAFVVKKPNLVPDVTEDSIKNYVTTQLNELKRPKKVIFIENLPHNQSGKVHRALLKRRAVEMETLKAHSSITPP